MGGTTSRSPRLAALLTFLCPGLGYMYIGKLNRGLLLNILFIAALAGFVGLFTAVEFFPLPPLLVMAGAWLVFSALAAGDVAKLARQQGPSFDPEGYNHWTMYAAVVLLTYVLPVAAVGVFSHEFLWDVSEAQTSAMYPNAQEGDTLLIRKRAFTGRLPRRGEVVAARFQGSSDYHVLRVVALPGETVTMEGNTLRIDGKRLPRYPLPDEVSTPPSLDPRGGFNLEVESNRGSDYVISFARNGSFPPTIEEMQLGEGELFLLADNRSHFDDDEDDAIRDSRDFGPVDASSLAGKPMFVAWSTTPGSGAIRWNRIGLRIQ